MALTPPSGFIRIVRAPQGEALEWVREQWIGLVLPYTELGPEPKSRSRPAGILSGQPVDIDGYHVSKGIAFQLLRRLRPNAALWWDANAPHLLEYPHIVEAPWLIFDRECAETLEIEPPQFEMYLDEFEFVLMLSQQT